MAMAEKNQGKPTHIYNPEAEYPWQYKYEHMALTVDCVMFSYDERRLRVLLIKRGLDPYKGMWALPGGFLNSNETAQEGALRELKEETSLVPSAIEQLGAFSRVDRDPRERVVTIAWYALVRPSEVHGGDDAAEAEWFDTENLPPMAFDHREIFEAAMNRLRQDIFFKPVGFDLLDETFTIPDLQRLYELILGRRFDRRNFQRKILSMGILDRANENPKDLPFYSEKESRSAHTDAAGDFLFETADPETEADAAPVMASARPKKKPRKGRPGKSFRLNRNLFDKAKEDGDGILDI